MWASVLILEPRTQSCSCKMLFRSFVTLRLIQWSLISAVKIVSLALLRCHLFPVHVLCFDSRKSLLNSSFVLWVELPLLPFWKLNCFLSQSANLRNIPGNISSISTFLFTRQITVKHEETVFHGCGVRKWCEQKRLLSIPPFLISLNQSLKPAGSVTQS